MMKRLIKLIFTTTIIISDFINPTLGFPVITSKIVVRWGHSATLVNSNIYYIGGRTDGNVFITELITLDVSKPFSTLNPGWIELDSTGAPKTIGHSAVNGGLSNDQIIIFGGGVDDPASAVMSNLWTYDTTNGKWTDPNLPQGGPSRRYEHSASISPSGMMWIYGGLIDGLTGSPTRNITSKLWGLNVNTLDSWKAYPLLNNSPGSRILHTSSIIDNKMIVIGGAKDGILHDMNEIYAFDLEKGTWEKNIGKGQIPVSRGQHSAVVSNRKIIIYGGSDITNTVLYGDVAVLDTRTWTWTSPVTTNSPPNRRDHTATLVGANMIVAFGRIGADAESNIYILNVLSWNWLIDYVPMDLPLDDDDFTQMKNTTNPDHKKDQPKDRHWLGCLPVIITLSVIGGFLFVAVLAYIIHKIINKRRSDRGVNLVAVPYNANPITIPPEMARIKRSRRPSFLSLVRKDSKKHDSAEMLNNPTSPANSTVPSTPASRGTHTPSHSDCGIIISGKQVRFSNNTDTLYHYDPDPENYLQQFNDIENHAGTSGTSGVNAYDMSKSSFESVEDIQSVSGESIVVASKQELRVVNL
ncbi:2845_t:CDS:1 [Funneliformis geosporum]|uniref:6531_t:CDS:1 n=1 Tax=Funneliformis geosporum TaxID=1117311 RepID=A0A9W4WLI7_9GLOM|nr:2845_t:CDS:1 [Funneliformis geosporum]CAI2162875.1 6531_t:CDS:1 [Funneliformis geosporum]